MSEREIYQARAKACEALLARLDRRGGWIANARAVSFLGAVGLAVATVLGKLPHAAYAGAAALAFAYFVLMAVHQRVLDAEARARLARELNRRGLKRLDGKWHDFPEKGEAFLSAEHPYAPDLDVFGQGSLFQRLCETGTKAGEARLADWLRAPADLGEVRARQEAVRELKGAIDFRQELLVEAQSASTKKADPTAFLRWAEEAPSLDRVRWARPFAWALPLASLGLFVLAGLGRLPAAWGWAGLLVQLGVVRLTGRHFADYYAALSSGEVGFSHFERTFAAIDRQRFGSARLETLRTAGASGASGPLRVFARRFSFAELRQSSQLHPVLNVALLWDVHALFAIEAWRGAHGSGVRRWFDALAELEALSALATFAFERPELTFPELSEEGPLFEAQALGHPLLDAPVRNDVALSRAGEALLVTGSNMSGKTTLLRAIGTNVVLALAGAPCCAERLLLSRLEVLTSMRVKDSLERGVSYFYAEVQRLKLLLDRARATQGQAIFLLDEILLGTNTRERQIASREVIRLLLATGAIGGVSTHDLTLATLEAESGGRVRNVHFRDHLEGEQMVFDYQLRPGVVATTNALRVLELAGIPVGGAEPEPQQ